MICSSAFTSHPCLFHHNPIANIALMSKYRQSGGENAWFRTEVSNTESVLKEWLWLWLEDILRHNKPCRSNGGIPLRLRAHSLLRKEMGRNCGKGGLPLASWLTQTAFTVFDWPDTTKDLTCLWYKAAWTCAMPSETWRLYSSLAFLWGFLLFWKEVKTLKIRDASWAWKFSRM